MKPKFYIGLVDARTEQAKSNEKAIAHLNELLKQKLLIWLNTSQQTSNDEFKQEKDLANVTGSISIELVVLTDKQDHHQCPLLTQLDRMGLTIEVLPNSLLVSSEASKADFLAAKCNVIIMLGDHLNDQAECYKKATYTDLNQNTQTLTELIRSDSLSSCVLNAVLAPELTTEHYQEYYFNTTEYLPFLYHIDTTHLVQTGKLASGFVRDKEKQAFLGFLQNFSNVCNELAEAKPNFVNNALKAKIRTCEKIGVKDISLADFYDITSKFDAMASEHQSRSNVSFWIMFSLTLVLGASFLLYAKVFTDSAWLLFVYLAAYSFGVVCFYRVKKRASLEKHLAYRLCAETMRLKLFQLVASENDKISAFQFERTISVANVKSDWIAHMVRSFPLHHLQDIVSLSDKKEIINEYLIDDQIDYFHLKLYGQNDSKSIIKHNPKISGIHKVLHSVSSLQMFIIVVNILLIITVTFTAYRIGVFESLYDLKSVMMFLVGFLPLVGLAFEQLIFNFALEENEMRYHHQISRFNSIKKWLQTASSQKQIEQVTEQLCVECAQEGFNWYTTRINRQHKPVSGG